MDLCLRSILSVAHATACYLLTQPWAQPGLFHTAHNGACTMVPRAPLSLLAWLASRLHAGRRFAYAHCGPQPVRLLQIAHHTSPGRITLPGFTVKDLDSWHVMNLERCLRLPDHLFLQYCSTSPDYVSRASGCD